MKELYISEIFDNFFQNRTHVQSIANYLNAIIHQLIQDSASLENKDNFLESAVDCNCSTLRAPDGPSEQAELTISLYTAGRCVLGARRVRQSDLEVVAEEEVSLYFGREESAACISSRILSAIVNLSENAVSDAFRNFVEQHLDGPSTNDQAQTPS